MYIHNVILNDLHYDILYAIPLVPLPILSVPLYYITLSIECQVFSSVISN